MRKTNLRRRYANLKILACRETNRLQQISQIHVTQKKKEKKNRKRSGFEDAKVVCVNLGDSRVSDNSGTGKDRGTFCALRKLHRRRDRCREQVCDRKAGGAAAA